MINSRKLEKKKLFYLKIISEYKIRGVIKKKEKEISMIVFKFNYRYHRRPHAECISPIGSQLVEHYSSMIPRSIPRLGDTD